MIPFCERYTGQPSPGATLPLPCKADAPVSPAITIPAAVLSELDTTPLTTGQVIGRLGFLDSPDMRKMVTRELQALGFVAESRRADWSGFEFVLFWVAGPERSR